MKRKLYNLNEKQLLMKFYFIRIKFWLKEIGYKREKKKNEHLADKFYVRVINISGQI